MQEAGSQVSQWATDRFGSAAEELVHAVPVAIARAHEKAEAAHAASGLRTNDAYGATMRVRMHDFLVEATAGLPGVTARKPAGVRSRFSYVVIEETAVVLVPWRYASDSSVQRIDAKLRRPVSDLRRTFFTLSATPSHVQPTLEDTLGDAVDLEAAFAEEQDAIAQLAELGSVVTVGIASNPHNGIIDLGWGDLELVDADTGAVAWHHWESLSMPAAAELRRPQLSAVGAVETAPMGRFDQVAEAEEFTLAPRQPLTSAPTSEPGLDEGGAEGQDEASN